MNNALKELAQCGDVGSLESALRALCSEFGSLSRLDILTMTGGGKPGAGKRQAVCLLRLDSSEQQQDLMTKLGAGRFGEDFMCRRRSENAGPSASVEGSLPK